VTSDKPSVPPQGYPPQGYPPTAYGSDQRSGTSGWLIALGVVMVLALGGLAAAIISKGDSDGASATTAPKPTTIQQNTTTKNTTTNVTTSAPAVTIQPNVTVSQSGTVGTVTSGAQTGTTTSP
jgi:hypothetical protein